MNQERGFLICGNSSHSLIYIGRRKKNKYITSTAFSREGETRTKGKQKNQKEKNKNLQRYK